MNFFDVGKKSYKKSSDSLRDLTIVNLKYTIFVDIKSEVQRAISEYLEIGGMHCVMCANAVERALKKIARRRSSLGELCVGIGGCYV